MAIGCPPSLLSVNVTRRPPWLYYLLLAALLFLIIHNISLPRPVIFRPGDVATSPLEINLSDDQTPFAHEPIGLGTLRDVREDRFYRGGTFTLISTTDKSVHPSPVIYDPYPDYSGDKWQPSSTGRYNACQGPRGKVLDRTNTEDMVLVYPGVQKDFPSPLIGSYAATGLDGSVCTDRYSRLGAYGYGDDQQGATPGFRHLGNLDWDIVNWRSLESQCFEINSERYKPGQVDPRRIEHVLPLAPPSTSKPIQRGDTDTASDLQFQPRSAVILRTWHDMEWTENHKHYVRSLIMELSLHSGAEYEVFLLCHVKDPNVSLHADDQDGMRRLKVKYVPPEFADMTILFNEEILKAWYPKVEEHSPNLQYWQPVQIFSQLYPNFDYYWHLEMDARLTGHAYHFMEQMTKFAKKQPRKYLWERNAYWYIPGAHGTWQDFVKMVDRSMKNKESVWGPKPVSWLTPAGPSPPVADPKNDNYEWGVGEEADFVSFLPIFDPSDTQWTYPNKLWNVPGDAPRRASPVAMGRLSRTLLHLMHDAEIKNGIGVVSEMTAPTFALWHGLKAVYVPHPLYLDGKWTSKELGRILNPGPPEKINGGGDSIWNFNHKWDHILFRMSYMFTAQTAEDLYRRWLGYKIDPHQYTDGTYHQDPQGRNWFESGDLREDLYGRLCYPPMFLHPIKNTAEKKGKAMAVPV